MTIGGIFFGIIIIVLGVLGIKYNYEITNSFGNSAFLARYFGQGNEYLVFKLLGLLCIIIGILIFFGIFDNIINFFLGPLKNLVNPN